MRTWLLFFLASIALAAADPACAADDASAPAGFERTVSRLHACGAGRCATPRRGDWTFHVAPYGWLAGVEGDVVAGGEQTSIEVPFEDLVERTEAGFQIYAEARWRKLFVAFDGTWATLTEDSEGVLIDTDFEINQRLFDMRLGYEVLRRSLDGPLPPCRERWRRQVVADVFVGARYWYTETIVTLTGLGGRSVEVSDTSERWDPFVGARIGWDITRRFAFGMRGDVGGFGIGDAAEFSWQVHAVIGYRLTSRISLLLGYRLLAFDTVTGSGTDRNGQDLLQHGPLIGVGFSF